MENNNKNIQDILNYVGEKLNGEDPKSRLLCLFSVASVLTAQISSMGIPLDETTKNIREQASDIMSKFSK